MQAEQLLIQKFASRPSTEELIIFIAQDDEMTSACSELQKKIARKNKTELKEINDLCLRYHISLAHLTRELDHVLSIFTPQADTSNDHKILGLQAGASIAEVKQAFRKLSIQYHPDTSGKNNTAKFIEITKAYQRIINSSNKKTAKTTQASSSAWRYQKKAPPLQERKKKNLYFFSLASATTLLIVITFLSIHYQKSAMLNNISKNKLSHSKQSVPTKETATTDEMQTAALQKNLTDSALKLKEITSPLSPTANTKKKYSLPSSNNSPKNVVPILLSHKNISQGSPEGPDATTQTEVEKLNTPASFSDTHIEYEKNTSQKDDQKSVNSISSKEKKHPHPSTDSDRFSSKIESKAAPPPLQNTTKQQETSSLFSGTPYKKAVVVKATEKKERK
ncbi:MAG: hypothetical protein D3909_10040, partial [Candidatus Electrothrix sp. ATG1]|nr:hypothetical protein [Candidatus Electrothrix sp. ATG1]